MSGAAAPLPGKNPHRRSPRSSGRKPGSYNGDPAAGGSLGQTILSPLEDALIQPWSPTPEKKRKKEKSYTGEWTPGSERCSFTHRSHQLYNTLLIGLCMPRTWSPLPPAYATLLSDNSKRPTLHIPGTPRCYFSFLAELCRRLCSAKSWRPKLLVPPPPNPRVSTPPPPPDLGASVAKRHLFSVVPPKGKCSQAGFWSFISLPC